jgi:hypothetical protein
VVNHRLKRLPFRLSRPVAVVVTFLAVTVGWVFFRMTSVGDIVHVLAAMGGLRGLGLPLTSLVPYLVVGAAMMWGVPEEWRWRFQTWGPRRLAPAAALAALALIYVNATQKFLYFQF